MQCAGSRFLGCLLGWLYAGSLACMRLSLFVEGDTRLWGYVCSVEWVSDCANGCRACVFGCFVYLRMAIDCGMRREIITSAEIGASEKSAFTLGWSLVCIFDSRIKIVLTGNST